MSRDVTKQKKTKKCHMLQSQRPGPDRQDRTNCNTGLCVTGGTAVHWEPSVQGDCTLHEILKATGGQHGEE